MAIPEMRTKARGEGGAQRHIHRHEPHQDCGPPTPRRTSCHDSTAPARPTAPGHSTSEHGCPHLLHTLDLLPNPLVKAPPLPSLESQLLVIKVHKGSI